MVLQVRHVPKRSEGNPGLRGDSMELCSSRGLLGVHPKSQNILHWLGINEKAYKYISMDNIPLVQGLFGKKLKDKTMKA